MRDLPLLFGIVTLLCLVAALTLSAYGHRPALMLPIAIACAVVFVRNGDGREHWTPATAQERQPPREPHARLLTDGSSGEDVPRPAAPAPARIAPWACTC